MLKPKTSRRESSGKNSALEEVMKEETTRLNAVIPESLHSRVKILAVHERSSITEIVIRALDDYLNKNSNE
jgi:predicted HicB family RNase H-like nuclease